MSTCSKRLGVFQDSWEGKMNIRVKCLTQIEALLQAHGIHRNDLSRKPRKVTPTRRKAPDGGTCKSHSSQRKGQVIVFAEPGSVDLVRLI